MAGASGQVLTAAAAPAQWVASPDLARMVWSLRVGEWAPSTQLAVAAPAETKLIGAPVSEPTIEEILDDELPDDLAPPRVETSEDNGRLHPFLVPKPKAKAKAKA